MNIIVRPYGSGACYCRPDTTWERENKDFYSPAFVDGLLWTPVVFARISKAGKCIGNRFSSRYYDAVGFGVLLYSDDKDLAFSSCLDHTSLLPSPLYDPVVLENGENLFEVSVGNENEVIEYDRTALKGLLEDAVCSASERTSLRIGDMVALELQPAKILAGRIDGEKSFSGTYCGNVLFDLKVIY